MSEDQNIPAEVPTDNSRQSTEENALPLSESEPQTANPVRPGHPGGYKLQTDKMEIHHAHHPTHKKKWTEYLIEFFMLFLAVFCGFIAENLREHGVEERREKQYMTSLVQDLQIDTANMVQVLQLGESISNKLDSFITALNSERPDTNVYLLYRLTIQSSRIVSCAFEDRTASQLKSSGNMRLIESADLSDSIRSYWEIIKMEEEIASRMIDMQDKISDIGVQIFHNKYLTRKDSTGRFAAGLVVAPDAKLLTTDNKLIAQMSNRLSGRRAVLNNYLRNLIAARDIAIRLIALIKNEYHLK